MQPTTDAFQAAAANADWVHAPGYFLILTDQPGDKSWPIVGLDLHPDAQGSGRQGGNSAEAVKFFKWSFVNGGKMAEDLDYIPMPESVIKLIEKTWSSDIKS